MRRPFRAHFRTTSYVVTYDLQTDDLTKHSVVKQKPYLFLNHSSDKIHEYHPRLVGTSGLDCDCLYTVKVYPHLKGQSKSVNIF